MTTYLALPTYGRRERSGIQPPFLQRTVFKRELSSSLLAYGFNQLWCEALNGDYDYFAMLHDDVDPVEAFWLDQLIDEAETHGADLLSAVVPLKSDTGLTSTALSDSDLFHRARMTLHQIYELPETFCIDDVPNAQGRHLLVNTGCMVVNLRGKWRNAERPPYFSIRDRLTRIDGQFVPLVCSEDWFFSECMHELGANVMATRKVKVNHVGHLKRKRYANYYEWGELTQDNKQTETVLA